MPKFKSIIICIIILCGIYLFYLDTQDKFETKGSQLYFNGNIITLDDDLKHPEAVYVLDGKIMAIGPEAKLRKLTSPNTQFIDLQGNTLLPGFIDPHTHPLVSTFLYGMVDVGGLTFSQPHEVWSHLEREVQHYNPGEWILCKGFDQVLIDGLLPPPISYLDSIAPQNPLMIASTSMHSYWVNSLGFERAGISNQTGNPSKESYYGRDEDGKLTGFISEQLAFDPIENAIINDVGKSTILKNSVNVLEDYAKNGNTSIVSMGLTTDDPNVIRLYHHLSSKKTSIVNKLLEKFGLLPSRNPTVRHFIYARYDSPHLLPTSVNNGDDFFKFLGIKFWYDGSPYTGTMYMDDHYIDNELTNHRLHFPHSHSGAPLLKDDELKTSIIEYENQGWQIAVHTQGDKAISEVLDIFDSVNNSDRLLRHRLEHCLMLDTQNILKMKQLNIHPSFHVNHIYYYGDALASSIIGGQRTQSILPVHNAEKKGLTYSLHADQPMFESNPIHLIHTAVNRKTRNGSLIGKKEKVTVESALKALTINAAWQMNMEDKLGSITVGKYADFVVLDENPLDIPSDKIININVLKTIVNGKQIYEWRLHE